MTDPQAPELSLSQPSELSVRDVAQVMFSQPNRLLVSPNHLRDVLFGGAIRRTDVQHTGPSAARPRAASTDARPFQVLEGGVAKLTIAGPLARRAGSFWYWEWDGYDAITARVEQALAANDVNAVLICFDSPGGEAAGCFEAARKMRELRAAHAKPIVAYIDELAASAAYALASACDEIVCPDTGEVGSIGVIVSMMEYSRMLDAEGITPNVVVSGKYKATGHWGLALTDEQRASVQRDVDHLAGLFASEVAAGRGGTAASWLALEADTRFGALALDAKLIDRVGGIGAALARAAELGGKRTTASAHAARSATNAGDEPVDTEGTEMSDIKNRVALSALALAVMAVCKIPADANVSEDDLAAKIREHEATHAATATTAATEAAALKADLASLVEASGATNVADARKAIASARLDSEQLKRREAEEAERLAKEKAEAERLAKEKAEADAAAKKAFIETAHKTGVISALEASLLQDTPFSLAEVKAKLDGRKPRGSNPLREPASPSSAEGKTEESRPTWNGKTFEQITSVTDMFKLATDEPELYERMLKDAIARGLAPADKPSDTAD